MATERKTKTDIDSSY